MLVKYGRRITALKYSLAILSAICLLVILFHYKEDNSIANNQTSQNKKLLNAEVEVSKPVFSSNGDHPYRIFAEAIIKDSGDTYHLNRISGIYNLNPQENISVLAKECFLSTKSDSISLNKDVNIGYQNYTLSTEQITIDLAKKSAENDDFVMILGDNGKITADRIKANDNFCDITLNGHVKAHFDTNHSK